MSKGWSWKWESLEVLEVQFPVVSVALKALGLESQNTAAADQKFGKRQKECGVFHCLDLTCLQEITWNRREALP